MISYKREILERLSSPNNVTQCSKTLQLSSSTVHKIIKRFREAGDCSVRNGKDLYWMHMVFGPSDNTASLISITVSLTLLNGPMNTSRNLCRLTRFALLSADGS